MAHKKGVGSSRNGRDSGPKYLGVKRFAGQFVTAGSILVKQRGTKFHPGQNVRRASDDTLFTVVDGVVRFEHKNKKRYRVSVYPGPRRWRPCPARASRSGLPRRTPRPATT